MRPVQFLLACVSLLDSFTSASAPSKQYISSVFQRIEGPKANFTSFFASVSPTVNWTIEGTHPLAGQYNNRTVLEATFARIGAVTAPAHPLSVTVINIVRDSESDWSVEELHITAICRNGLIFDNRYAWATRWSNGIIVEARAYLDSALVSAALQQNEIAALFTYTDLRNTIVPYLSLSEPIVQGATGLKKQASN